MTYNEQKMNRNVEKPQILCRGGEAIGIINSIIKELMTDQKKNQERRLLVSYFANPEQATSSIKIRALSLDEALGMVSVLGDSYMSFIRVNNKMYNLSRQEKASKLYEYAVAGLHDKSFEMDESGKEIVDAYRRGNHTISFNIRRRSAKQRRERLLRTQAQ